MALRRVSFAFFVCIRSCVCILVSFLGHRIHLPCLFFSLQIKAVGNIFIFMSFYLSFLFFVQDFHLKLRCQEEVEEDEASSSFSKWGLTWNYARIYPVIRCQWVSMFSVWGPGTFRHRHSVGGCWTFQCSAPNCE